MKKNSQISDYKKELGKLLFNVPLYTITNVNTKLIIKNELEFLDNHSDDDPSYIEHTLFIENPEYELFKSIVYKDITNLYGYCPYCKKDLILTSKGKELPEKLRDNLVYQEIEIRSQDQYEDALECAIRAFDNRVHELIELSFDYDRCFVRTFECTSKHKHKMFVTFHLNYQYELIKIGQYPSLIEFDKTLEQYKKELSKKEFREFNRALGLESHAVGIGSFVYLRRIFERLVEDKLKLKKKEEVPNKMDEKIEYLAAELPDFLVKNKMMYGILSKGIHELEEEECLQYFEPLKDAIYFILEENKQKKDQDKTKKAVSAHLNSINANLKEKQQN